VPGLENVYIDLVLDYFMGVGKYGGDNDSMDNEESGLEIYFFK